MSKPQTIIEKIMSRHCGKTVYADDIAEIKIDARVARDFGGANVVKHIRGHQLGIADPSRTFFTFDCNPGGSDQNYATNQHICRLFARTAGIHVFDIDQGIGTHLAMDRGLVRPGETFVSTDSHANIMGAIGAFGQGMGDQDIAWAFANGTVWFKVPHSVRIVLHGTRPPHVTAKDLTLHLLRQFGASGLLGLAAEMSGPVVEAMTLAERVTMASMATEMGAIILLFPPNDAVLEELPGRDANRGEVIQPDEGATAVTEYAIDVSSLEPLCSKPGHPEDVVPVSMLEGTAIDSAFIGSCTNGRYVDLEAAAAILRTHPIKPSVLLKIVPATDDIWRMCLEKGLIATLKKAGAFIGNAGCAGCAAGQIGQNGPGEVTVSTGNRNFTGKQGKGAVYLASPATVAASAVAGVICSAARLEKVLESTRNVIILPVSAAEAARLEEKRGTAERQAEKPPLVSGRIWVIEQDNIDTDMIFHNRHLTVTKIEEMGRFAFGNLKGWEDFSTKAIPGDIIVTGANFGAGSSRQQAVDCFSSLGISLIIARSFGAIYERNAINAGLPIMQADLSGLGAVDGSILTVDLKTGIIRMQGSDRDVQGIPFSNVQWDIYQRGGLLATYA